MKKYRKIRIALIIKKVNWESKQLVQEAKKSNARLEVFIVDNFCDLKKIKKIERCDVIIWRGSFLDKNFGRATFLNLFKGKIVINQGIIDQPFISYKFFQQKYIEKHTNIATIKTYLFSNSQELKAALDKNILSFPIIAKPNWGAQGNGILKLNSLKDLKTIKKEDYSNLIFQPYIKNKGDFRVLYVGSVPLGIIKRVRKKGSFLNNISQGATAQKISFQSCLGQELIETTKQIPSIFNLGLCGVDIIFDTDKQKYFFLELNTVPQWKGFEKNTGVKVANSIITLSHKLYERQKNNNQAKIVKTYYDKNLDYQFDKSFHYLSRIYLWTRDKNLRPLLNKFKQTYHSSEGEAMYQNLKSIYYRKTSSKDLELIKNYQSRKAYLKKYPNLRNLNKLLYKNLFAFTIYKKDIGKIIGQIVKKQEFSKLERALKKDPEAIKKLSTIAINYFYLFNFYFKRKNEPEFLFKIAKEMREDSVEEIDLKIYLLTHCIIGESLFYYRKVDTGNKVYDKMIKEIEAIIERNYFFCSLDNKFEFLVCAKLCSYKTRLKKIIENEAKLSYSDIGNFLIDKNNYYKFGLAKKDFFESEHRNVLFIMSQMKRNF